MRKTLLALAFWIASAPALAQDGARSAASGFEPELARKTGADERGMRHYVPTILKTGPTRVESIDEAEALVAGDPVIANGEVVAEHHAWYGSAATMLVPGLHEKLQPPAKE